MWRWARDARPGYGAKGEGKYYCWYLCAFAYRHLLNYHPTFRGKDPLNVFLPHYAAWWKDGMPDFSDRMKCPPRES